MSKKQLARIADALENIASNQAELLGIMKKTATKSNQDLSTHASMFSEMKTMLDPFLDSAIAKMERGSTLPETESRPSLPPQQPAIERNGIRIQAASTPHEVEVDVK